MIDSDAQRHGRCLGIQDALGDACARHAKEKGTPCFNENSVKDEGRSEREATPAPKKKQKLSPLFFFHLPVCCTKYRIALL